MNPLEIQLRSWAPRRPSAKLERRLFEADRRRARAERQARSEMPTLHLRWLAPATAALVMLFVLYGQRMETGPRGNNDSGAIMAMITSNRSVTPYLPSNFQRDQNGPPADTFEWTNGSGSTSSISSLSDSKGRN